jgi:hypothetical protein
MRGGAISLFFQQMESNRRLANRASRYGRGRYLEDLRVRLLDVQTLQEGYLCTNRTFYSNKDKDSPAACALNVQELQGGDGHRDSCF